MQIRTTANLASTSPPADPDPGCLNCGVALTDQFCARCGQSAHTHRFTFAHLLHEIPHSIWHVDRGLPYTIKEMFMRPGHTMRRYLAGQRVDLFRPVALVLLLAGLMSFLLLAMNIPLVEPTRPPTTPAEREAVAVGKVIFKYFAWFTVAMLPLYAVLSWALLRRLGYNFVEHLIANALAMGGVLVLQMLFYPLLAWTSGTPAFKTVTGLDTLMMPAYQMWAFTLFGLGAYRLAGSLWRGAAIAFVGLVLNVLLLQVLALAIVRITH